MAASGCRQKIESLRNKSSPTVSRRWVVPSPSPFSPVKLTSNFGLASRTERKHISATCGRLLQSNKGLTQGSQGKDSCKGQSASSPWGQRWLQKAPPAFPWHSSLHVFSWESKIPEFQKTTDEARGDIVQTQSWRKSAKICPKESH